MDLFNVVTLPLKKLANLLFSLVVQLPDGSSNIGSLVVVGVIFIVIIGAIMHSSASGRFSNIISRLRKRKE